MTDKSVQIKVLTPKQQKLVRLILEDIGKKGSTKTKEQLMLEAGYAPSTARTEAKEIFASDGVQALVRPFVEELDEKRKMALKHITEKKLKTASGYSNALILDIMTKNHQLLTGKPTQRTDNLDEEEKKKILALFKRNNESKSRSR